MTVQPACALALLLLLAGRAQAEPCSVRVQQVAAGSSHRCALLTDGTVRCWGANYAGQLGDGTSVFRTVPVRVAGLTEVAEIAAGERHTCARRRDGSVWCWGANERGQSGAPLPPGTAAHALPRPHLDRAAPVAGVSGATALAAGETHVLALTGDGGIFFWGAGAAVAGPDAGVSAPFRMKLGPARAIAAGDGVSCAWLRAGQAVCWGRDVWWLGHFEAAPFAPVRVPVLARMAGVSIGLGRLCGIGDDGRLRCTAGGPMPPRDSQPRPELVGGLGPVVQAAVASHGCAVERAGVVRCWDRNDAGQAGAEPSAPLATPAVVPGLGPMVEVSVGGDHTCARSSDGGVFCWGENGHGQLGDATTASRARPGEVRFCATSAAPVFLEPPAGVPVVVALHRSGCYGSCPIYSLRVYADGAVIYRGAANVLVRSGRRKQLAPAELRELLDAFSGAHFFELKERCEDAWTDNPTVTVFFSDGKRRRLFRDYHGCKDADPTWRKLEDTVDRITGSSAWVGPRRGRPAGVSDFEAFEPHPFEP